MVPEDDDDVIRLKGLQSKVEKFTNSVNTLFSRCKSKIAKPRVIEETVEVEVEVMEYNVKSSN